MILFDSNILSFSARNLTMIDEMLLDINVYGLSHVCANEVFESFSKVDYDHYFNFDSPTHNFPNLDIHHTKIWKEEKFDHQVEFYFRGSKDYPTNYQNLFEYLVATEYNGLLDS